MYSRCTLSERMSRDRGFEYQSSRVCRSAIKISHEIRFTFLPAPYSADLAVSSCHSLKNDRVRDIDRTRHCYSLRGNDGSIAVGARLFYSFRFRAVCGSVSFIFHRSSCLMYYYKTLRDCAKKERRRERDFHTVRPHEKGKERERETFARPT